MNNGIEKFSCRFADNLNNRSNDDIKKNMNIILIIINTEKLMMIKDGINI